MSKYLQVKKGKVLESKLVEVNLATKALEKGPITHRAVYREVTSYIDKNNHIPAYVNGLE